MGQPFMGDSLLSGICASCIRFSKVNLPICINFALSVMSYGGGRLRRLSLPSLGSLFNAILQLGRILPLKHPFFLWKRPLAVRCDDELIEFPLLLAVNMSVRLLPLETTR